jgi:hypothetical protein
VATAENFREPGSALFDEADLYPGMREDKPVLRSGDANTRYDPIADAIF